ncbi:MerR family transcriptional regulator [Paraburkholderia sp. NMBU_R16]|uniref:MerR family transcriptional regulator n=1 Tax=Paraburkholderia sp. NMBU_R16 TaxID=2698676 RepID=UPI00156660C0|nr:MerR family transcriptional regulator [Paraburkholderia sp. NMBU_R16]NRO95546.1 MerR family transcriptional regulator [Paraburkholderia sp. NMBU_R16]
MLLDIAEVARQSGLAPSALRYYEKRKLIVSRGRNGLRRTFDPEVVSRLALISCARAAGFTLAQIGRFLAATPNNVDLQARMAEQAERLDEEIARLSRMRDGLRHAASCTHTPLVECPKFKALFKGSISELPETSHCGTSVD